ncbi:MAG: coenzyme F420 hydrogenase subunit gamma [Methanobacterium sp.]|uniref:coenzyme F420 hydrogenase subunit gamma n=1 Tax=Methanobacterium sp. TaxID=2164 RepID=UPI003D64D864|nr:coenzyme F420 hydrogenase subunit gamma [Methanobacterium sp.]
MLARIKEILGIEAKPETGEVASEEEVEKVAEEKPRPRIGYIHLSGCTGDVMSLSENYDILAPLLTEMVEIVYGQTLADVWWDDENPMPEMDIALVEGSVCLQDEHSLKEIKEVREKAGLVVAFGSCAATGCFTRYSRGGQQAQPAHESFVPVADVVKVDLAMPGCPPSPEIIAKTVVAAINGDMDYLQPMIDLAGTTEGCGCDLQLKVVNQALCIGCGTCAMSCQTRAVEMLNGRPEVNSDRCVKCGVCYVQCPRSWWPMERIKKDTGL